MTTNLPICTGQIHRSLCHTLNHLEPRPTLLASNPYSMSTSGFVGQMDRHWAMSDPLDWWFYYSARSRHRYDGHMVFISFSFQIFSLRSRALLWVYSYVTDRSSFVAELLYLFPQHQVTMWILSSWFSSDGPLTWPYHKIISNDLWNCAKETTYKVWTGYRELVFGLLPEGPKGTWKKVS